MRRQAELLKLRFGSALATEIKDDEIITITGLQGRPPKEIRRRTLSNIIQSRMEEIVEFVAAEIKHSGYEKKLVGGIVVTGGGSMLAHTKQLIEYVTGIDTRMGMPGEHLASGLVDEVNSPMYATSTGLVIQGLNAGEPSSRSQAEQRQPALEERPSSKKEKPQAPRTVAERPNMSIIGRVKDWFESTMTNTGDFIE
jgi:cell division protein FtsA